MSYLGEETKVTDEDKPEKKGSMIPILGEGLGGFLKGLGWGKVIDPETGVEKTNWMPIIMTGGAVVGGLILLTAVTRKPRRRRRR